MLSPVSLSKSLGHTLGPELRVCILLTPQSRLIAYASSPPNAEDPMKILLSLSAEAWRDAEAQARDTATDGGSLTKEDEFVRLDCELGRVIIMPVYPSHGGTMDLSPSSSFQSDSLDSTTPKRSGPAGSLVGRKQSQKDSEAGSDGALSSRGSGSGGVKFLLALNASSSVPWGLIRAKGRHLRTFLSTSLGEVGERLEARANASPPNGGR